MYSTLCEKGLNFLEKTQWGFVMYLCYVHEDHALMQLGHKTASQGFISKSVDTPAKKLNSFYPTTPSPPNYTYTHSMSSLHTPLKSFYLFKV